MTNYARLIQQVAGGFVRYSARLDYADSTSKTERNRLHTNAFRTLKDAKPR